MNDEETGLQAKSSKAEHLKPWQFKPGQSGNPSGKVKGTLSLKAFARQMIQDMTDPEKLEFMKGLDKDIIWEMAEGKAQSNTDLNLKGDMIIQISEAIARKNDTNSIPKPNSEQSQ